MGAHAALTILFLLTGQWVSFLLNAPLLAWNVQKYAKPISPHIPHALTSGVAHRVRTQNHMYDATEIFRTLGSEKKESFIKLGFYLITFFYYLYRYVSIVTRVPYQAD